MTIDHPSFEGLNPKVPFDIFEGKTDYKYWVGRIEETQSEELLLEAIGKFRANVYVKEMQFLSNDVIDGNGLEFDEDDKRSTQFAVIENITKENDKLARIVGYGRLILKKEANDYLPIEKQFPELFIAEEAKSGSVEVSRFISRHEDSSTQHIIGLSVIRAMTHYCVKRNIDSAYFEIERPLSHLLNYIGLPMSQLGRPKDVIEPGGKRSLYPVGINPFLIIESVKTDAHNNVLLKKFFEQESENDGIGYYPPELVGGVNVK